MPRSITPTLMFDGSAEEAIRFYVSVFPRSEIRRIDRWSPGEEREGFVERAEFTVSGLDLVAFDTPVTHEFTFTPATSFFVECESEAELDGIYARLSDDGHVLMPLDTYAFSRRFAWVNDRFGVSWQLNVS